MTERRRWRAVRVNALEGLSSPMPYTVPWLTMVPHVGEPGIVDAIARASSVRRGTADHAACCSSSVPSAATRR